MITLSPADAQTLTNDACAIIERFHDKAWLRIKGRVKRPQWEPRFVAHLCASMADTAAAWRKTLSTSHPSLQLSLSTVFTHQTPYVKWTPPGGAYKRCELADLLVAVLDRTTTNPQGFATLIQAKQSENMSISLATSSEKKQFELLSGRPVFDVDAATAPTKVDLKRKAPDVALQYGLTPPDALPPAHPRWSAHRWRTAGGLTARAGTYSATTTTCLADALVELLQGNRGWPFDLPPSGSDWTHFQHAGSRDDWAMLINYLLERSFVSPVKALKAAGTTGDRREEYQLYFRAQTPSGQPMFFLRNLPQGFVGPLPFHELAESLPARIGSWEEDRSEWSFPEEENGDGPPASGDTAPDGANPENGPISVVVFELTDRHSAWAEAISGLNK